MGRETCRLKIGYCTGMEGLSLEAPLPLSSVSCDVQDQREGQGRWVTSSFSFLGFLSLQSIYYFVCESVLITCMSMYHRCAWCLWRSEDSVRVPGTAVMNGCEKSPPSSPRTSLAHQPTHLLSFPLSNLNLCHFSPKVEISG